MNVLGVFAKRPEAGRTKTRLAASIGDNAATNLYVAFVEDLLERISQRAKERPTERRIISVAPKDPATQTWFEHRMSNDCELQFQCDGKLGDRIQCFFETAFAAEASRVVLIGSDSPDIPSELINQAFERLKAADMVLAPAADGGFVLIGFSRPTSGLFKNVPWSTPATLTATIMAAQELNLTVELLAPWYDIDTVDNLGTLLAMQRVAGSAAAECPRTRDCLELLWPDIHQSILEENSHK